MYRLYLLLLLHTEQNTVLLVATCCNQARLEKFPLRRLHLLQSSKISASGALHEHFDAM